MTRRAVVLAAVLAAGIGGARAMTLTGHDNNIVELLQQSQDIVVGKVANVTDGLDEKGIPYTEITLQVTESIRGTLGDEYKFRQFGLLKPRPVGDGKRTMMPAPPGFPKYAVGEDVVLMLRPSAKWTGFRMPAGVTVGKFKLGPGRVANDTNNEGLFRGVQLDNGLVNENEKQMMKAGGPANPDTFLSFLRKAVREHWVENGRMRRADVKPALPRSGR
ncbi:MAG TPA: hypothetical protein VFV19_07695 [Candidatus Polarisedimenticolaceae bacterium]|nr:hypothetical protein [Candidatus Polarisedimenticolaceae bacterium]